MIKELKIKNLKEMREAKGFSQNQLATKTGLNVRTLQAYERGGNDINGAKLKTLAVLALNLGCKISDILEEDAELKKLLEKVEL